MKDISIGISDDYAVVQFDSGSFYYGYETAECSVCGERGEYCEDHHMDNEWCFKAVVNETVWIYPHSELVGPDNKFDVINNLLVGIGKWMNESTFYGEST